MPTESSARVPPNPYTMRIQQSLEIAATGRVPTQPTRLTRRKRHLVVAADAWNEFATVWFIRRGHGGAPVDETMHLVFEEAGWSCTGGGGGTPGADVTTRPGLDEIAQQQHNLARARRDEPRFGFLVGASIGRHRASIRFQAVAEAQTLRVAGREPRPIAHHGFCLVEFDPGHPPIIEAVDGSGEGLGSFTPALTARREPMHQRPLRRFGTPSPRQG
ncbi:MAG: hypothetical protein AAF567_08165 [Actinomycetota bacterium]